MKHQSIRSEIGPFVICYDNFLPESLALELANKVTTMDPRHLFYRRTAVDKEGKVITQVIPNTPSYEKIIETPTDRDNYRMKYHFMATATTDPDSSHETGCDCIYCELHHTIYANRPPEVDGMYMSETFLSVYKQGDFLSQHNDQADWREYAFTYNLNPIWRPEWGGMLNIGVRHSWIGLSPTFNRLILMKLERKGVNHFVGEVTPSARYNRITFSGWFGNNHVDP